jgi:hypothetical protein
MPIRLHNHTKLKYATKKGSLFRLPFFCTTFRLRKIYQGKGTLGMLIQDSTMAESLSKTMGNLQKSSKGLNENMKAANSNFLLRGYFRKKEKAAEKKRKKHIP